MATFGTAVDITVAELAIESFFPADEATAEAVRRHAAAQDRRLPAMPWQTETQVLPSILSADFGNFRRQVRELLDAGARTFHVDVMDGHFVPVITFGPKVVAALADTVHERGGHLDVHLMIESPERLLPEFAKAGADSCTVHVEACPHLHYTIQLLHELGMGAAVHPEPGDAGRGPGRGGRRYADHALCMSVNPGWGGQ